MAAISLKLPDDLLDASRECAEALRVPRAEYIRRAIERMNARRATGCVQSAWPTRRARCGEKAERSTPSSPPSSETPMPDRSDVWLADLNPRRGTEPGKTRPVLIVQAGPAGRRPPVDTDHPAHHKAGRRR
jgi:hypothetical protein